MGRPTKTQDLTVVTGTYEKDGVTKKRYLTIGRLTTRDDGNQSFDISCVPVGRDGKGYVFEQRERDNTAKNNTQSEATVDDVLDDLPF